MKKRKNERIYIIYLKDLIIHRDKDTHNLSAGVTANALQAYLLGVCEFAYLVRQFAFKDAKCIFLDFVKRYFCGFSINGRLKNQSLFSKSCQFLAN